MPAIKTEPGTEEPLHAIAQADSMSKSAKRRRESEGRRDYERKAKRRRKADRREKAQAGEVWQYLVSAMSSNALEMPRSLTSKLYWRDLMGLPRKRDLPAAWKTRLTSERPSPRILRLLAAYLVGDDPSGYICGLNGSNCSAQWNTVGPAMATYEEETATIYRAAAFPKCILYPKLDSSKSSSGPRQCCNAVYRDFNNPAMPGIWSPPASIRAPVSSPAPSSSSSPTPSSSSSSSSSSSYSPPPATTPLNRVQRALPSVPHPETPIHHIIDEAPAQQETGFITGLWEQRNEAMYLSGPGNASTSYAHSASWLQQREGQVIPTGTDGSTLQVLDLQNTGTTTPLASDFQNLSCIVFEGTVEVILQDVPVFTISRGGHWAVGVGKECRVRNPRTGSKAVLYIVGISA